jgi:hypothetical protein
MFCDYVDVARGMVYKLFLYSLRRKVGFVVESGVSGICSFATSPPRFIGCKESGMKGQAYSVIKLKNTLYV